MTLKTLFKDLIRPVAGRVSLVAQAGLVMAIIVALSLTSMISSMFVTDSLDGDAGNINLAGSLRMQTIRLSRALMLDYSALNNNIEDINSRAKPDLNQVIKETLEFDRRFNQLMASSALIHDSQSEIQKLKREISESWIKLKDIIQNDPLHLLNSPELTETFLDDIDRLVFVLQRLSEDKLKVLRLIQGASMFLILLTAFIALYRMNQSIVQPMNELVKAADDAGRGKFSSLPNSNSQDEIGLLINTFNDMSAQLKEMHENFEKSVNDKTKALATSNQSLELLYLVSRKLVGDTTHDNLTELIGRIEETINLGKIAVCLSEHHNNEFFTKYNSSVNQDKPCTIGDCMSCIEKCVYKYQFSLMQGDEHFGYLQVHVEPSVQIQQWQKQLLQAIADNIAFALSLEKQREQNSLFLLMEERAVIARELHDSLAQSLSYLKVQVSVLERQMDKKVDASIVESTIGELKSGLNNAYRQLRELLTTFRLKLDEPSLRNAIQATVVEFSARCHHPIALNYTLPSDLLSANEKVHVLQIVREALSNVHRHANASSAQVDIHSNGEGITVRITDDGIGLSENMDREGHYGIAIMKERSASLKASIKLTSAYDKGTQVLIQFTPMNRPHITDLRKQIVEEVI